MSAYAFRVLFVGSGGPTEEKVGHKSRHTREPYSIAKERERERCVTDCECTYVRLVRDVDSVDVELKPLVLCSC